jgi:predicted flap endonuclease-1-like 5' DNA nuclease
MPLAPDTVFIPHVRIDLQNPRGTNRPVYAPIYEQPLLERLWKDSGVEIVVTAIAETGPKGRPWPADMLGRETTEAEEEARLKNKYRHNPSTKEPIFETVYGFGRFQEAFARAESGAWGARSTATATATATAPVQRDRPEVHPAMQAKSEDSIQEQIDSGDYKTADTDAAPTGSEEGPGNSPWDHLNAVNGLSDELSRALFDDGIDTVAEIASMSAAEIAKYPGIGKKSGQSIIDSASELTLASLEE